MTYISREEELDARRAFRRRVRTIMEERGLDWQTLALRADCSIKLLSLVLHSTDGCTHPRIALRILAALGIKDKGDARWMTNRGRWDALMLDVNRPAGDWQEINWARLKRIAYRNHNSLNGLSIQLGKNSQFLNGHKTRHLRVATDDVMRLAELLGVQPKDIIIKEENAG